MSAKYNGFDSQSQTGKNFYSFDPKGYFAVFLQALISSISLNLYITVKKLKMGTLKLSLTGSVSLGTGVMIGAGIFGAYTLRLFPEEYAGYASALGVGLLALAFIVNVLGNKVIGATATTTAIIKVAGIALLAITGLAIAGFPDITGNFVSNNSIK